MYPPINHIEGVHVYILHAGYWFTYMLLLICCRYFFQELESYIGNEEFVIMLTDLRCPYDDHLLKQKQSQKYKKLSKNGTLASTLEEVHRYPVYGWYTCISCMLCVLVFLLLSVLIRSLHMVLHVHYDLCKFWMMSSPTLILCTTYKCIHFICAGPWLSKPHW